MSKADNKELEEAIKTLKEIINLCKDDIANNNTNTTAILDLKDLKSLFIILEELKRLEEENEIQRRLLNAVFDRVFIHKDKLIKKMEEHKNRVLKLKKLLN